MDRPMKEFRVAITQPNIIFGGRLQVILGLVKALNELGIEPDILTLNLGFDPATIQEKYGQDLRMGFKRICRIFPWHLFSQDYKILIFNFLLKFQKNKYDLIVDSGNSQIFLPKKPTILSYIHFPREYRIRNNYLLEQITSNKITRIHANKLSNRLLRGLYRLSKVRSNQVFVCNSTYTEESLRSVYRDMTNETYIVYPPVVLSQFSCPYSQRPESIVSLGRYTPEKGQLDQIKLAEQMPETDFKIIGFVFSQKYFDDCQAYINTHHVENVKLLPNLAFGDLISALQSSKYFLHTLENEPFGITAVQAIAAGCIPIVHDSGGQREVVPFDFLRFQSVDEIPEIIRHVEELSQDAVSKLISTLQQNARENYDAAVFHHRMVTIFSYIIERASSKD